MHAEITHLLQELQAGDSAARDRLVELLYGELHRMAYQQLHSERADHTLQPTALVHEAYLRVFSGNTPEFAGRAHFLALSSIAMRRILVDYARTRNASRRGAGRQRVTMSNLGAEEAIETTDLLELNAALEALAKDREISARYLEMHYFGGMTAEEIAEATGRSPHTVRHALRFARAWLRRYLER